MELKKYRGNITSQWGEDAIIAEICRRLEIKNGCCVEFGAWDGKHLSNTWHLWHDLGWSAVLIEGEGNRVKVLREAIKKYPKVIPYWAFVQTEGENSLDSILEQLRQTRVDLLSIDIDGDDYYILESLKIKPTILIVEYNPTIPPSMSVVGGKNDFFGCSAKMLVDLGQKKGYQLAAITNTNCIFVRKDEFPRLATQPVSLDKEFPTNQLTYLISSQNGIFFANRLPPYAKVKTPWHRQPILFHGDDSSLVPLTLKFFGLKDRLKQKINNLKTRLKTRKPLFDSAEK